MGSNLKLQINFMFHLSCGTLPDFLRANFRVPFVQQDADSRSRFQAQKRGHGALIQQMNMVGHEADQIHSDTVLFRLRGECFKHPPPVTVIADDLLALVATETHMIDRARKMHS